MSPFGSNRQTNRSSWTRSSPASNSPEKKRLTDEFMNSLPDVIQNEGEIETVLKDMKKNPKY